MILLLLIALAVLLWIIQREMDEAPDVEEQSFGSNCPACQAETDIDWMVCPHCQQRLRESCPCCHRGKLINQKFCPFCGQGSERLAA